MKYEMLFSPINIGTLTIKNRIVMSAAEFSLGQPNGKPTETLLDYYEERAKGGVGLIIPGICRVNDTGAPSTFTQLAMSHDYHIEPMKELVERVHKHGAKLAIQLHHPGRQGLGTPINSLPAAIPLIDNVPHARELIFSCTPLLDAIDKKKLYFSLQAPSKGELSNQGAMRIHAMTRHEINKVQRDFINAAVRCKKAGVDAVELHGTHGYLIQQFLSPHTNRRTDEYGGSFDNRMRFVQEIIEGIRRECGEDYPLIVRLTVDEMYDRIGRPGVGYTLETGKKIAKRLEELGVDAINVSSASYDVYNGWLEPTSYKPGWRKHLAKAIKETVDIPVIAAGVIRTPEQAEKQLQEGCQDMVASARNFICDPYWALKAIEGRENEIRHCIGCCHCIQSFISNAFKGIPGECALNMGVAAEKEYFNMPQDGDRRLVIVLGAGVAGLTAAETLARRGFAVELYEKRRKLGGQLITASTNKHKKRLYCAIEDLKVLCEKAGVNIKLGKVLKADEIIERQPYAVVVATGGIPLRPRSIPGLDADNVITAPEIILKKVKLSDSDVVVVGSGMTGLEAVETLNEGGNRVTVIEMAPVIAPGTWFQHVVDSMERIEGHGTEFMVGTQLCSVEKNQALGKSFVKYRDVKTGQTGFLKADYVVLSLGVRPDIAIVDELKEKGAGCAGGINILRVGDACKSGNIAAATHDAYRKAMEL